MKYILISLVVTCFLLQGCKDEFFNTPPRAAETEASFYTNIENIESATIACYSMLNTQGSYDLGYMMLTGEIAGDDMEAGGRDAAEIPDIQEIDRMTYTADNFRLRKIWGYYYKGVYFCNQFIKYFPDLHTTGLTDEQTVLLDTRIGEVRFLRALYYHMLTQVFGGVILLESPAVPSEFQSVSRATVKEIYELIESDLTEAINLLPDKGSVDAPGRASKQAAQALLGKVLLYESSYAKYNAGDARLGAMTQRWGEAFTQLEAVISSDECSLIGLDGSTFETFWSPTTDAYRYIFTVEGDNSVESIFEIQEIMDLSGGWIQSRGNGLTSWGTFRKYLATPTGTTEVDFGWGWMTPSQALADLYEDGDPRIKTTCGTTGDSALIPDVGWKYLAMSYSPTGYCLRKYECSPEQYWTVNGSDWNRGPINEKVIRIADVYLMAAEAAFENGDAATALEYVNLVRRRADMCDGSEDGIPAQYTAVTLQNIRDERRLELTGEGHRFFDIVRWGVAEDLLAGQLLVHNTIPCSFESPKYDFFPIPQTEIDVVGSTLEQYEGW